MFYFYFFLFWTLLCLVRKAKELGLCLHRYNEKKNPDGHKILTNLIKLALFKSDLVEKTVEVIEKRVEAVYGGSSLAKLTYLVGDYTYLITSEVTGWRMLDPIALSSTNKLTERIIQQRQIIIKRKPNFILDLVQAHTLVSYYRDWFSNNLKK